ncbi:SDR family oxidoreductase [Auraticoccus monumenti]|uniref:NADP-dependent 3-hydroxy acid dehydrogenase YdfG n=1 Tax=Auraticoccus monumenti TaxID=675864 RepID=A0A1G6TCA4_9ACTN|nr:SDR family oxidoreductase [Auraticoccus monumenti]SDD26087.1 NADP-dependent 3-hydroxy acid dehydrogenase YdfG [Auraticoccus monumenti]
MDKVLWVTGGGSGMGAAAARHAAGQGWRVAISGRREDALAQVAATITAAGGEALTVPLDVTDPEQVRAAHDTVLQQWGRLDGLVLSAGLNNPRRSWADQNMDDFARIVDTNLVAIARVIDVSLPELRQRQGVVVVISSYAGWQVSPMAGVAYSASKTALSSVAISLNKQEGEHGVRACHLCPGDVATEFLQQRPNVPDAAAQAKMLTPEDIGRAVLFVLDSPSHVRIDELVISPVSQR